MTLSPRTFLAATAVTALGGTQLASAASPPGDVVGKVTVGYQGWFASRVSSRVICSPGTDGTAT